MSWHTTARVRRAENSSDLSEKQEDADVDVLRAVGISGRLHSLGAHMTRVLNRGQLSDRRAATDELVCRLQQKFTELSESQANVVAMVAVWRWLNPACAPCKGLGYGVVDGTTTLSDVPCTECHGSGKVVVEMSEKIKPAVEWAGSVIDQEVQQFGASVNRRLGR